MNQRSNKIKKTILIKASSYLGVNANGGEAHTLLSFCQFLSEDYIVLIVGPEVFPNELRPYIIKPLLTYRTLPRFIRVFAHVPVSIINTIKAAKELRPTLVMCVGGVFYNGLAAVIASEIFGKKNLVRTAEDHLGSAQAQSSILKKIGHRLFIGPVSMLTLNLAQNVMTVGFASRNYFIDCGLEPSKISYAVSPIQVERFTGSSKVSKEQILLNLGMDPSKKLLLYVGAISKVKGADLLPEIIRRIKQKTDEWQFLIIGNESSTKKKITLELEKVGQADIRIIGPQQHEDLLSYYKAASTLVFLCRVGVGYGLVTIEAALADCPVLCLNPKLDVKTLHPNSPSNIQDLVSIILCSQYRVPDVFKLIDNGASRKQHLDIIDRCING